MGRCSVSNAEIVVDAWGGGRAYWHVAREDPSETTWREGCLPPGPYTLPISPVRAAVR